MKLKELALEIAQNEIAAGACEQDENNAGPFVEKYLLGLAEPPANWCAAFVSWCYLEAFKRSYSAPPKDWDFYRFRYSLSARAIHNEFKKYNRLVDVPVPGDLIFFWRGSINSWMGHIGLVFAIDLDLNKLITIEGNKGKFPAKVDYYRYWLNDIPQLLGFGSV